MTDDKRRAKARRKYARRRARLLGLPMPEFAVSNGGRPRLPEEQHLLPKEFLEHQRERQLERMRQRRRMMGIPSREEKKAANAVARERAAKECRLIREAERAARRERRLEMFRLKAKSWRARNPDRKREYDRRSRAENKEKVLAANRIRYFRAKVRGYRWKPSPEYIERQHAKRLAATAALRYLQSHGLIKRGSPEFRLEIRRSAALAYARQHGLL